MMLLFIKHSFFISLPLQRNRRVNQMIHAGVQFFHGQCPRLNRPDQFPRRIQSRGRHLQVGVYLDRLYMVVGAAPVRNDDSVKSPFLS